jgi:hypothetical protein
LKAVWLRRGLNLWPPFLAAGIRVRHLSEDYRSAEVEMPLRWYNRNYVRTHFGGSLYAMTDPFYMLMLMHCLGPEYHVWDRAASIEYLAPAKGTVTARFALDDTRLDDIRRLTAGGEKYLPEFIIDVTDRSGAVVARVKRSVYVRLKPRARPTGETA